jgi:CubicO group peptidase (beta-lactamase class C family)
VIRTRVIPVALLSLALAAGAAAEALAPLPPQPAGVAWPTAEWPEAPPGAEVDRAALAAAIDAVFARPGRAGRPDGRALLVVHRGVVVAERYAPGVDRSTRHVSWSMAKSVTQALAGILVRDGRLALAAPAPVPAWQADGDPRRAITLDHLLHMTSGLDNADGFEGGPGSLVARLIFGPGAADQFAFASAFPAREPPDRRWAYSTATSTLVAGIVQREVGSTRDAMLDFMRRELFEPLGMRSAEPEFDAAGGFQGGAFVWATARDWARFGTLYLRDGVWDGRRILPDGWVDYTRTPAPAPNNGTHGAHFWLNREPREGQFRIAPGAPSSAFAACGAYGQYVLMVPTRDLVVVRLGQMHAHSFDDLGRQLAAVVAAFPPLAPEAE